MAFMPKSNTPHAEPLSHIRSVIAFLEEAAREMGNVKVPKNAERQQRLDQLGLDIRHIRARISPLALQIESDAKREAGE
jgi:hypothetical protein